MTNYIIYTCNRRNFAVMENSSSTVPVYHQLHSGIVRLMSKYLNDLTKIESMTEDGLLIHLLLLMKWSKFDFD